MTHAEAAPRVSAHRGAPTSVPDIDALALPVLPDADSGVVLGPGWAEFLEIHDVDAFALLDFAAAKGAAGEVTEHVVTTDGRPLQVLLVGIGGGATGDLRRAGAALGRRTRGRKRVATSLTALADDEGLQAFVEGVVLGSFRYHLKTNGAGSPAPVEVILASMALTASREKFLARAVEVAEAAAYARVLATIPSNIKTPRWLADEARSLGRRAGFTVEVWDEKRLRAEGFGGILGVGQASTNRPCFVRIDYTPPKANRRTKHIALVGKGITFDTGGLSIKPGEMMVNMKRDMTGAGVVLAVMSALSTVGCKVRVTGLLACAENSIGGNAMRPGDVLRHYGGRTTEVTNTDAEGRLVLADGLAYAAAQIKPDALVDVATLTGAMKVALGLRTAGFFSTSDALADAIVAAGEVAGEPFWRLPLVTDYADGLASKVADSDNAGAGPGAIVAALFLKDFVEGLPWMHLDIASVGDSATDAHEWTSGPTGFGVRALLGWLGQDDPLAGV
jgi:leucyl aminopeptidase